MIVETTVKTDSSKQLQYPLITLALTAITEEQRQQHPAVTSKVVPVIDGVQKKFQPSRFGNENVLSLYEDDKMLFAYNTETGIVRFSPDCQKKVIFEVTLYLSKRANVPMTEEELVKGGAYTHYKGGCYKVVGFTNLHAKDNPQFIPQVVYHSISPNDPDIWYSRPMAEFLEKFRPMTPEDVLTSTGQ